MTWTTNQSQQCSSPWLVSQPITASRLSAIWGGSYRLLHFQQLVPTLWFGLCATCSKQYFGNSISISWCGPRTTLWYLVSLSVQLPCSRPDVKQHGSDAASDTWECCSYSLAKHQEVLAAAGNDHRNSRNDLPPEIHRIALPAYKQHHSFQSWSTKSLITKRLNEVSASVSSMILSSSWHIICNVGDNLPPR